MAIAASWKVNALSVTSSAAIYTTATSGYLRDLVITNGGPSTLFVAMGTGCTAATTAQSMYIGAGSSLVLTEGQVPNSGIIFGVSAGTSATFVGYGSLVNYT